nr:hypothetical protein BaRGS_014391 [Batillaria attramentaria]
MVERWTFDARVEQVVELYQKLHTGENPELLDQFESILLGVIKDVRGYQQENERLEKTFKREKEQHDKHLRQLEEEMETQMQKVEERVRKTGEGETGAREGGDEGTVRRRGQLTTTESETTYSRPTWRFVRSELTSFRQQFYEKVHELNL